MYRIVELIIDEKDETSGIDAVSVVESPAIESDFIALKKHEIELKEVGFSASLHTPGIMVEFTPKAPIP